MKILITGISSFTGKYLKTHFSSKNNITVEGVSTSDKSANYYLSSFNINNIRDILERSGPDYIIHLTGLSSGANTNDLAIFNINYYYTKYLLEAAKLSRRNIKNIILPSTGYIYGNQNTIITERNIPKPNSDYAISKYSMEQLKHIYNDCLNISIVRFFNYTGRGQNSNFLIPKIVNAFKERKDLQLGNLQISRDISDVRDISYAYEKILYMKNDNVINVSSGNTYTIMQILELMRDITNVNIKISSNKEFQRSNEINVIRTNTQLLKSLIPDWSPRHLKNTLLWMYNN